MKHRTFGVSQTPSLQRNAARAAIAGILALTESAYCQATFYAFYASPNLATFAWALSGDGTSVVGSGQWVDTATEPWRWTVAGGMERLTHANGGAYGVSRDGSVLALIEYSQLSQWRNGVRVPVNGTGLLPATVSGMSAAGDVIVGNWHGPQGWRGYRWTEGALATDMGLPPGFTELETHSVSGDGDVVVGSLRSAADERAFRWSPSGGFRDLGLLPGRPISRAWAVSADGQVIVGVGFTPGTTYDAVPFVWTSDRGMQPLGSSLGSARGVSGDGSVVVGNLPTGRRFVWTAATGMRDLIEIATDYGAQIPLELLTTMVSDDGRTFAGQARDGPYIRGWMLRFPPPFACYANCDGSPLLNVADFVCFMQRFAAGDPYANCDGSTQPPVLNAADFVCFQQRFAAGCP